MEANLTRFSLGFAISRRRTVHQPYSSSSLSVTNNKHRKLSKMRGNSNSKDSFNAAAYEAERLTLDSKAREEMAEIASKQMVGPSSNNFSEEGGEEEDSRAWKWRIRKRIWDLMEAENIAQFPRPVHHRIPNFIGATAAAKKVGELDVFRRANCVKVNPDSPQKQVRFLTLSGGKKLLTPQPRLRTGFFSVLESASLSNATINEACTSFGVAKFGRPIGLDEKIKVDQLIIGSVAVDPNTGARLGKGEGFAELEYGMLRYVGAIDDTTLVVTSGCDLTERFPPTSRTKENVKIALAIPNEERVFVPLKEKCEDSSMENSQTVSKASDGNFLMYDKQLVGDIPVEKLIIHDVPVDIICTPTQVIFTNTPIPKPQGIYWDKLSPEKLSQIRILRDLKRRIERETGQKLPCGPSKKLPPTAQRKN